MQLLLDSYFEQEEITKLVGDFNWDVITLSFRSENTKRQKNSLKYIVKLINEATRKEDQSKTKHRRRGSIRFWKRDKADGEDDLVFFDVSELLELIEKHEIAGELLKRDAEIITAGFEILVFLTKYGKFDKEELIGVAEKYHIEYSLETLGNI